MRKVVLAILVAIMILVGGIYWNTKPQEEYKTLSVVNVSLNTTALEEAGYFTIEEEGYFEIEEDSEFHRRSSCEICEAMQGGEITPTFWLEESDNFTVIMEEGVYGLNEPTFKFYPENTHNIEVKLVRP